MRFEVPQFIEVEAKIVGPLTWKQFIYVAGGVGLLLILYLTTPFIIFVLIGLPAGILAGSLAFHKINNRPFSIFLESVVNYLLKNKLYLWQRNETQTITERDPATQTPTTPLAYTNKKTITSLSRNLEIHNAQSE